MLWLIIAILSYLILAIVFLVDKYLLVSSIPNPKVYVFYVGILGVLVLIILPFIDFCIPKIDFVFLSLITGIIFLYALFWFYKTLKNFEASRVIPAISGLIPLFTFLLVYFFDKEKLFFWKREGLAFLFLIIGTFLINFKKEKTITFKSFQFSLLTAFLFSIAFVLTKHVYLNLSFWTGFVWMKIGGFLMAIGFYFIFPEIKKEIFQQRNTFPNKTMGIFVMNQIGGAVANILQNWSIALAPLIYIPFINALQGIQYVFLLIFAIFLSIKFPHILKEEISRKIIFQKIFAISLIIGGIFLFMLK